MIAALYVQRGGAYYGLPDVDPWDEARDARLYDGPHPVVAHPPCSRWCQLAHMNQARYGHRVGDDGGCFVAALTAVRRWGGVLEHPAFSHAWREFGLPRPTRAWSRLLGDTAWVCEVSQSAYGHAARKLTWLYFVGGEPPEMRWCETAPTAQISFCANHGDSDLPRLSKRAASATPPELRETLIAMARSVSVEALR